MIKEYYVLTIYHRENKVRSYVKGIYSSMSKALDIAAESIDILEVASKGNWVAGVDKFTVDQKGTKTVVLDPSDWRV